MELLEPDDARLAPATDLAVACDAVRGVPPGDAAMERFRRAVLAFAAAHPDALHRSCVEGHLTGSALVVDHTGERVLLLHHRKLERWLQPGGHTDGEANLAATALREASEETGIVGLRVALPAIDIDVHRIEARAEPAHDHLDVRYLVLAPPDAVISGNHESTALKWVDPSELAAHGADAGLERLVAAAQKAFALL